MVAKTEKCDGCAGTGEACDHVMATCQSCDGTTMYQPTKPCGKCTDGWHLTTRSKKRVKCRAELGGCGGTGRKPAGRKVLCDCVGMAGPNGKRWTRVNFRTCTQCGGSGRYTPHFMPLETMLSEETLAALELVKG